MKNEFIPSLYRKKNKDIKSITLKKIKVFMIIVILINIFLIKDNICSFKNNQINASEVNEVNELPKKNIDAVEKLEYLDSNFILESLNIKNIKINSNEIELTILINNKKEYMDTIREIEEIYSIKTISPIIEEGNEKFIKVMI
ncbi:hypothetical protein KQI36_01385 [Clostridium senegalense]|uniref:hypothetical protein n=1 Tax=Clostridium senegalense TaxID=1465809 RepID=UPI001C11D5C8|nr:hypothetical protein [Clostridium senegalense]MBU5225317.1 hypothetical protein [Clostridium senegalense]